MASELNMTKNLLMLALLAVVLMSPVAIHARCDAVGDLSTPSAKFEASQVSPIEALMRFGEKNDLCFGVQYVDKSLLTTPSNFNIQNMTIREAIEKILGSGSSLKIESINGVIEISPRVTSGKKTVLDHVIGNWVAARGPLQIVSWLLDIQLVKELNPQIKGFGGDSPAGDSLDEVGPFNETNRSVRFLLDKIVAQSKGGIWISLIPSGTSGRQAILEGRRAWSIVQYQGATAGYAGTLNAVAAQLP